MNWKKIIILKNYAQKIELRKNDLVILISLLFIKFSRLINLFRPNIFSLFDNYIFI